MLLSYNDILQSRNRDKSGKYHDIILVMVLPDSIVNFKANSVKVFFFSKILMHINEIISSIHF